MRPLVTYYYLFITEYISLVLHIVLENIFSSLRSSILGTGLSTLAYASNITGPNTITIIAISIKIPLTILSPPCYILLQNLIPVTSIPASPIVVNMVFVIESSILYSMKLVPKLYIIAKVIHKINSSFFIFTSCLFGLCLLIVFIYINLSRCC